MRPMTRSQPPSPSIETRVDTLEMRVAYQDETIEALNKTITAQWQQIDALGREIVNLRDRLSEAENRSGEAAAQEQPPHY